MHLGRVLWGNLRWWGTLRRDVLRWWDTLRRDTVGTLVYVRAGVRVLRCLLFEGLVCTGNAPSAIDAQGDAHGEKNKDWQGSVSRKEF
jgi:hypothetical protein